MFKNNIPFITLDKDFNIIDAHPDIKNSYSNLLLPDFFRNLLVGYDLDHFTQPIELNISMFDINDIKLVFFNDGGTLKCIPVKSEIYGTKSFRNVHYQMREPVSSIFAILPLLADSINKGDAAKAFRNLDVLNMQSYKLLKNINNISLSSRIIGGNIPEKEYVNFSILLESLIAAIRTVEKNITIDASVEPGVYLNVNRSFITNAVLNLISNSINFRTDENVQITIHLKKNEKNAIFSYSDNSKGIKDEFLPFVFTPYYSKDPFADGEADPSMGLGLFIVKNAFEHADGKILLTSVFGKGVKYTVSFPVITPDCDILESSATDFLLNRYSDLFVQLCDSCRLPGLK